MLQKITGLIYQCSKQPRLFVPIRPWKPSLSTGAYPKEEHVKRTPLLGKLRPQWKGGTNTLAYSSV
jgi:hypothetical protein